MSSLLRDVLLPSWPRSCCVALALAGCAARAPVAPAPRPSIAPLPDAGAARDVPPNTREVPPVDAAVRSDVPVFTDQPAQAPIDVAPGRFAGETLTALLPMVAVYPEPRVSDDWRGYLRAGGTARITAGPLGDEGCPPRADRRDTGWYQVEGGGYVCVSRGAVLTRHLGREARAALPLAPTLDASLPYRYAWVQRTAVSYRALPTAEEERLTEPSRTDGGATLPAFPPTTGPVTLESLEGDPRTPVLRRLLRGMYVAVERATRGPSGALYWRSVRGGYVRVDDVGNVGNRGPRGVALREGMQLPVAFVRVDGVSLRALGADGVLRRQGRAPRLSAWSIPDPTPVTWRDQSFVRTADGRLLRPEDLTLVTASNAPEEVAPDERWIEVNLDRQSLVAYEGARPVYATLVATGLPSTDPEANYETVQGGFRIRHKHISTTMDGNAAGGPYAMEEVPWAMFFEDSFALHGAYWHAAFGAPRSHGCVNLSPEDARWVFAWSAPSVPAGWHAAFAADDDPGTRIYVRYDRQRLGEAGRPAVIPGH